MSHSQLRNNCRQENKIKKILQESNEKFIKLKANEDFAEEIYIFALLKIIYEKPLTDGLDDQAKFKVVSLPKNKDVDVSQNVKDAFKEQLLDPIVGIKKKLNKNFQQPPKFLKSRIQKLFLFQVMIPIYTKWIK